MSTGEDFVALVLAAGQGKRMRSRMPKVVHPLLGRPMVCYPVDAALAAGANQVVCVIGHGADDVSKVLSSRYGERVRTALKYIEPDKLWLAPDCGLMTISRDLANAKAKLLVEVANEVRKTL